MAVSSQIGRHSYYSIYPLSSYYCDRTTLFIEIYFGGLYSLQFSTYSLYKESAIQTCYITKVSGKHFIK
jgi:hypothetical protein